MNNKIKHICKTIRPPLFWLLGCVFAINAMAQDGTPLSAKLQDLAKPGSSLEWIYFMDNPSLDPKTIFTRYKTDFGLTADDEMKVKRTEKDDIGFIHTRYDQMYKGHRVMYGEYILHQRPDGILGVANGKLITGLNLAATPSLNERQALDAALQFMHASEYLWENADMEKELKRIKNDPNATYFPKGELVFAPSVRGQYKASSYRLAWTFDIYTNDMKVLAKRVCIDALTGKVLLSTDIAMDCSGGTGTSAFNGSVSVSTELNSGVYRSHNDCQATDIYVYNCNRGGASNTYYTDVDNSWTQQSAVQAMWGAAQVYSYYYNTHSRQSWDGSAGDMIAYNNANIPNLGVNNACWGCTGNNAIFGAGTTTNATDDWNTNDIMGHEFTHGVTQDEANLDYSDESGALNESFSDIFGEMVESWSESVCDYLVGADRGAIRSFSNPNAYSDPDTYQGTYWYSGSADNGGVHTNSGVQNFWFYLLSEGGSGTNDLGKSYNVTGITRFKARLIAYRSLSQYLVSSSQYIDARKGALQAAIDLYGGCSVEAIAVGDAWHAVGVEGQSSAYTINACGIYPIGGTWLQAISTLTASSGGCATTITSGSHVYFTARDNVIMYPGFTATSGSNFTAYLEPCSSTRYFAAQNPPMSDLEKGIKPVAFGNTLPEKSIPDNKSISIESNTIQVAPNPFNGNFTLTIQAVKDYRAQVIIYNSQGVKVHQQTGVNLHKGVNTLPFNLPNLAAGTYLLEVNFGDGKITKMIIKG